MSAIIQEVVDLGDRSYPIRIGAGLLSQPGALDRELGSADVLIVTNTTVGPLYEMQCRQLLGERRIETIELPDGESYKTVATLETILDRLVEGRFARDAVIVALGGGVVGDIAGFAAATYQRGISFVQVPTTLLAQVDSAVGGKTAVNHPGGKNLIGAFHQPRAVLVDIDTLQTLPDRELSAGLAEVIKYGCIVDREFFDWLEANAQDLAGRDGKALTHAIHRSCQLKAAIVAQDETEAGRRALLNLGHTFGHAIERCMGYGEWLHGEAVAAGICMAAEFSARLGRLQDSDVDRVRSLIAAMNLPVQAPSISSADFMSAMAIDKKVVAGAIRLVLFKTIGEADITADFPLDELTAYLSEQPGA